MTKPLTVRSKFKTEVEIVFLDGTSVTGMSFLAPDQRIVDAFNDGRAFIPFEASDGSLMMIRKEAIRYIRPKDATTQQAENAPLYFGRL
jgi:hypothetical protein